MKIRAIAFDVYGTLIDPCGVKTALEVMMGDRAQAFADLWRRTQINYSFRRSILQLFKPFTQCTYDALIYSAAVLKVDLSDTQITELMTTYRQLPPYGDVTDTLQHLQEAGIKIFAFSNGAHSDLVDLFLHAGLIDFFSELVTVEDVKRFKPDPLVYQHLCASIDIPVSKILFVSANPFDVQGAIHSKLPTVWLRRTELTVFDPWGPQPETQIRSLAELAYLLT